VFKDKASLERAITGLNSFALGDIFGLDIEETRRKNSLLMLFIAVKGDDKVDPGSGVSTTQSE
jgi:hypothetical protein